MPCSIDLHCHTRASADGSLTMADVKSMLENGPLDVIAITDHDTIVAAVKLHEQFGDAIIVGEEISTQHGEIIGLYLQETIQPGKSAKETVLEIKRQNGLVYIPHPFETGRKGLQLETLEEIKEEIDMIEVVNGRSFSAAARKRAAKWAVQNNVAAMASSDAHGRIGWGRVYTSLPHNPNREDMRKQLQQAVVIGSLNGPLAYVYPFINRLRYKKGDYKWI